MDQTNGTTKKKQVFFSIGSYSEKDKRVINKISANSLFGSADSSVTLRNEPAKERAAPPRRLLRERPASLDVTDDARSYHTLPNLRKVQPLSSLVLREDEDERLVEIVHRNGALQSNGGPGGAAVEKPTCPPSNSGQDSCCVRTGEEEGQGLDKPAYPPKLYNRSLSLEPEQLRHTGKVALTIAAYEGEPRTPTRLDFLPQSRRLSRSSSKASSSDGGASSVASTPLDESTPTVDTEPIGHRLQSELVATLKRSNLKKRSDEDGLEEATPPPSPALQENGKIESPEAQPEPKDEKKQEESTEQPKEEVDIPNGSVKNLATVLNQKLTFRVKPDIEQVDSPDEIHEEKKEESPEQPKEEIKVSKSNVEKMATVLDQKLTFRIKPDIEQVDVSEDEEEVKEEEKKEEVKKELKTDEKNEEKKEVKADVKIEEQIEVKTDEKNEEKKEVKTDEKNEGKKEVMTDEIKEVKKEVETDEIKEMKKEVETDEKKEEKKEVKTDEIKEVKKEVETDEIKEVKKEVKTEEIKEEKKEGEKKQEVTEQPKE